MNLDGFKDTQSELGSFFMSDITFNVMVRLRDKLDTNIANEMMLGNNCKDLVTIEDYLVLHDV